MLFLSHYPPFDSFYIFHLSQDSGKEFLNVSFYLW